MVGHPVELLVSGEHQLGEKLTAAVTDGRLRATTGLAIVEESLAAAGS